MEELYTYLGYIVIAILCYLIFTTVVQNKIGEGFLGKKSKTDDKKNDDTDMKKIQDSIDELNKKTSDAVNSFGLIKHRKIWENLIIAIEDRINSITLAALPILSKKIAADPSDDHIEKMIENMNTLNKFRSTLSENMKYLDGLE
jgi:low affinity Fe/Cu permease